MKKFLKIFLVVLFIGAFIGMLYWLVVSSKDKKVTWNTETVFKHTIEEKTVVTGSVEPRKEVEIKPQINGIIERLYVEPGDYINTGDLVAKINIIPEMVSLNNAKTRIKKCKIQLEDAERLYKKQKKLYEKNVISEVEYLKHEVVFLNAQEDLKSAENNLELLEKGALSSDDKATNTLVRSTTSGMVLAVPVKEGNSVIMSNSFNAGTTIATIANMKDMIFIGKIDESEVGKLKEQMDLKISIGAIEDVKLDAKLEYISPKGLVENGAIQFEIKAKVKPVDSVFVRAGYSANADIVLERRDSVHCVKESWIKFDKDSAFVDIETEPMTFEKRKIKIGLSDGINVEVLEGLTADDQIKAGRKKDKKKDKKKVNNEAHS